MIYGSCTSNDQNSRNSLGGWVVAPLEEKEKITPHTNGI